MPFYKLQIDQNGSQIKHVTFAIEQELQKLFEVGLPQLLGVRLIIGEINSSRVNYNGAVLTHLVWIRIDY